MTEPIDPLLAFAEHALRMTDRALSGRSYRQVEGIDHHRLTYDECDAIRKDERSTIENNAAKDQT